MGSRIGGGQQLGYIGKRSQKCSNFKEDDSVLPLYELLGARIGGGSTAGLYRKRCMDLVSFETQQEYDWVKGFINGKHFKILL